MRDELDEYLAGKRLWGDDFSPAQIEAWYEDEREAYALLSSEGRDAYQYVYHALNMHHGYRHLPKGPLGSVLGLGSAYGHEFAPIRDRIGQLTIVEASE